MSLHLDLRILAKRFISGKSCIRNYSKSSLHDTPGSATSVNSPSAKIVTPLPPLTVPLPGLPEPQYATLLPEHHNTKVTTLSNGLRVASENRFGQFFTVGVVIDSGPRYEIAYPSGVSHFLEKLAFHSTVAYPDKDCILRELEKHGGICDCQSSRDTFVYAASAENRGLEAVTKVLAEVVLRPRLDITEVSMAKQAVLFELESLAMRPEQDVKLMDMIHAAAYRDNTLGLPKLCPPQNAELLNRNVLLTYLKQHHTPKRMVVAGVGVPHETLVEMVNKYFVDSEPIWVKEGIDSSKSLQIDSSTAQYTGGILKESCEIPMYAAEGLPELAHVVLGLRGCSHQDSDFIAACVLNMMMGGGGSFSAGGPGKGMYTRLYTNVLNRYHWMYSATAFNHAYADTGLFCIHASAPPTHIRGVTEVLCRELVAMSAVPGPQELRRAKTQLQSMLLMNLEARPVVFEDIGRQVLATGMRKRPEFFIEAIENIQAEDIIRVARRFLSSPPAVAARGDIKKLPELSDIAMALLNEDGKMPSGRKLSLFK
uniref:Mitochondrial-processing peptidase subunit alpha n=1 Tax=Xenopsylla cheopis TaxID=163159 RepID=A0A6M2DEP9_XENCH